MVWVSESQIWDPDSGVFRDLVPNLDSQQILDPRSASPAEFPDSGCQNVRFQDLRSDVEKSDFCVTFDRKVVFWYQISNSDARIDFFDHMARFSAIPDVLSIIRTFLRYFDLFDTDLGTDLGAIWYRLRCHF